MNPTGPIFKYFGGKWRIADWIIDHFPAHDVYVEPFCGAASVFLRKPLARINVLNDLDERIVSVFRVLRDPKKSRRLAHLLYHTPYSRAEYKLCEHMTDDDVENARRLITASHQGFGSAGISKGLFPIWSFSTLRDKPGTFLKITGNVRLWHRKMRSAYLECADFREVIKDWDSAETLFYCDPPYVAETRSHGKYAKEISDDDHVKLSDMLNSIEGMAIVSGYRSDLYNRLYQGWRRIDRKNQSMTNTKRIESIWLSPNCADVIPDLFSDYEKNS